MWNRFVVLVVLATILVASLPGSSEAQSPPQVLNATSLLNWVPPKDWYAKFPYYVSGFSKEGQPIFVWEFGKWNFNPFMTGGPEKAKMMENYVEQTVQFAIQLGKAFEDYDGLIFLADFEGFKYLQLTHSPTVLMFLRILKFVPQFEPYMYRRIAINANYVAENLFSIMAPIVGSAIAKADLYGTNKIRWRAKLSTIIPKNQLAPWYLGSKNWTPLQVLGKGEPLDIERLRKAQKTFLKQMSKESPKESARF